NSGCCLGPTRPPPYSPRFPSTTLFRSVDHLDGYVQYLVPEEERGEGPAGFFGLGLADRVDVERIPEVARATREAGVRVVPTQTLDRKSTRLNSSHVKTSYAVFCLKKKT